MVVAVLIGSVRAERMSARAAAWVVARLSQRGHEAVLVDPAKLELPLLDKMWKEVKNSEAPQDAALRAKLKPVADLYERADGFCVVTPEYNHSVPPALSNLIDYFLEEYAYKPSAIVSCSSGPYGGVRAAIQLRALLAEAGMPSIPTLQPIPTIQSSLSEAGVALTQQMAEKADPFFQEFDWYMRALKAERAKGTS